MKYKKTEAGQLAVKERSALLSSRQRSLLIMVDGQKEMADLVRTVTGLGGTVEDVNVLLVHALIEGIGAAVPVPQAGAVALASASALSLAAEAPAVPVAVPARETLSDQQLYQRAYPVATKLTSSLGLRGFRLNLAVEGAGDYQSLLAVASRIREAVGEEKFRALGQALAND